MDVRLVLWLVAGGVVAGAPLATLVPGAAPALAALAGVLTVAALAMRRRRPAGLAVALAVAAAALGTARAADVINPRLPDDDVARLALPARAVLVGRIVEPPARRRGRVVLVVAAEELGDGRARRAASGRIRLSVRSPVRRWRQGDRLAVASTLRRPRNFENPGRLDWVGHLARRGIHVTAAVWDDGAIRRLPATRPTIGDRLAHARDDVARAVRAALPARAGAVLRALVVGDEGGVDPALRTAFTRAGVVHVLSVSGLHVALVGAAGFMAARWLLVRSEVLALAWPVERVAAVLALGPIAAYAGLAGLAVPTLRAALMAVATTLALLLGRRADVARTLALAAAVVALAVPGAPLDAGFQLSFVSVAAIVVGAGRFAPPAARGWGARVWTAAIVGLAALVGTAPLTAFHFHQVSLVGLVANPLVIPLFGSAAVIPGLAGAALLPVSPAAARLLFGAAGAVVARGITLVTWMARPAWAALDVPTPDALELALCYALLVGVALRPGTVRRLVLAGALVGLAIDAAWWLSARHAVDRLRVTFLDVGQGDAAVAELPGGPVLVVDAGGFPASDFDTGTAVVEPFLHARKLRVPDVVAMSHAHPDHAGGLAALLAAPGVRAFWWNGRPGTGRQWQRLLATVSASGTPVRRLAAGDRAVPLAGAVEVLHPIAGDRGLSLNDGSLTLVLRHGGVRVLLTGDIEARAEAALLARGARLDAQVVKVPHHGSRTSSTPAFVAAVRAQVAVISVGADNRYRLPAADVEARWRAAGACVLRTDRCGAVSVVSDGARVRVETYRPGCGCPGLDAR